MILQVLDVMHNMNINWPWHRLFEFPTIGTLYTGITAFSPGTINPEVLGALPQFARNNNPFQDAMMLYSLERSGSQRTEINIGYEDRNCD